MNAKNSMIRFALFVWKNTSAFMALVLIVVAVLIGHWAGSSGSGGVELVGHDGHGEGVVGESEPSVYTCSMHPAVRLEDPDAKCPICFMDLIPVEDNGGDAGDENRLVLSEAAAKMSGVETMAVERFLPTAEVRLYGKMGYDETSVARISAYFPGRIERLFVNYVGVPVQEGDHLAEMYSPELIAGFEELRQARRSIDESSGGSAFMRETSMAMLEASREKLRLFGLRPDQIERIEAGEFDSDELTIYSPIGGVVTALNVREGAYLKDGDLIATVADLSRLWLDLEAYESQLALLRWGVGVRFTVESFPGEVFEGMVSFIEPFVDERTRTATVRVAVDNADHRLKPGMFASAVARPRVDAGGAVVSDELGGMWVGPMHPTVVRDEPGECEICGMELVSAESLGVVGDPSEVRVPLVVPSSAVLWTGRRSVVYVRAADADEPAYEGRVVELGVRAGDWQTVVSGLDEGEEVVVNGAFRIDSAMQILAKPSMMSMGGDVEDGGMELGAKVPDAFVDGLGAVYDLYLDAQERLADDDLEGFNSAAQRLAGAAGEVKTMGLMGEALGIWRRESGKLRHMMSFSSIDDARVSFEVMSLAMMEIEERFGHSGDRQLHIAYCPMAFDFMGAKWIQRGMEINNPYFGSQMLRCGEILETLDPVDGLNGGHGDE